MMPKDGLSRNDYAVLGAVTSLRGDHARALADFDYHWKSVSRIPQPGSMVGASSSSTASIQTTTAIRHHTPELD